MSYLEQPPGSGSGNDASGNYSGGVSTILWTVTDGCGNTSTCKTAVTINNGVHTDTLVTACKNFTWNRNGQSYTTSQNVDYIFTDAQGCQDTVTLKTHHQQWDTCRYTGDGL
jgi:hypothetical protein